MTVPWTEVRYDGDSRDHAATRRRKLLDYLKAKDGQRYLSLIAKLGLRK